MKLRLDRMKKKRSNSPPPATGGSMKTCVKVVKSFSVDRTTLEYVSSTKGGHSASERVNELLRRAIVDEQYERLERQAARFFAAISQEEREEATAFHDATVRSLARD